MFKSFYECDCLCHETKQGLTVKHIGPCCYICEYCNANIRKSCIHFHEEECKQLYSTKIE